MGRQILGINHVADEVHHLDLHLDLITCHGTIQRPQRRCKRKCGKENRAQYLDGEQKFYCFHHKAQAKLASDTSIEAHSNPSSSNSKSQKDGSVTLRISEQPNKHVEVLSKTPDVRIKQELVEPSPPQQSCLQYQGLSLKNELPSTFKQLAALGLAYLQSAFNAESADLNIKSSWLTGLLGKAEPETKAERYDPSQPPRTPDAPLSQSKPPRSPQITTDWASYQSPHPTYPEVLTPTKQTCGLKHEPLPLPPLPICISAKTVNKLRKRLLAAPSPTDREGYIYIYWKTKAESASALVNAAQDGTESLVKRYAFEKDGRKVLHLKIGRAVDVDARMKKWKRQCGFPVNLFRAYPLPSTATVDERALPKRARMVPNYTLVERLIHIELEAMRIPPKQCASCPAKHTEWFQIYATAVNVHLVEKVVEKWVNWSIAMFSSGFP